MRTYFVVEGPHDAGRWLYWQVGCRLRRELLGDKRADYCQRVVETVAASLTAEFGRGFDRRSLYRMMRFVEVFPDSEIVAALRPQLSWTHLRELISIEDALKRQFYTELCRLERWSTRTLKAKKACACPEPAFALSGIIANSSGDIAFMRSQNGQRALLPGPCHKKSAQPRPSPRPAKPQSTAPLTPAP